LPALPALNPQSNMTLSLAHHSLSSCSRLLIAAAIVWCLVSHATATQEANQALLQLSAPALNASVAVQGLSFYALFGPVEPFAGLVVTSFVGSSSTQLAQGCAPLIPANASLIPGSWVAVLIRGNCSFGEKVNRSFAAGSAGVIIVDNVDENDPPFMVDPNNSDTGNISAVSITLVAGYQILNMSLMYPLLNISSAVGPTYIEIGSSGLTLSSIVFAHILVFGMGLLISNFLITFHTTPFPPRWNRLGHVTMCDGCLLLSRKG